MRISFRAHANEDDETGADHNLVGEGVHKDTEVGLEVATAGNDTIRDVSKAANEEQEAGGGGGPFPVDQQDDNKGSGDKKPRGGELVGEIHRGRAQGMPAGRSGTDLEVVVIDRGGGLVDETATELWGVLGSALAFPSLNAKVGAGN